MWQKLFHMIDTNNDAFFGIFAVVICFVLVIEWLSRKTKKKNGH